ncbi:hypothetical protein A3D71_02110 [Candidatus Kaiserbacteria bacterium RIFCSPHIGHO2_02_FULL_55_20]|uniref:Uncharacterized protein n=1 Tax=Candidatus Kaiserbacteria bacterium RIFCSPHIGHO2_02_FULL_55_20 TaxID=1798497 RepID=A0A1F6DX38_9BACT|nr:MAG: hypothetical protein A2680_02970 [Candidatus Kaiserbacteria bacterium RIFCSPHIGHO2_01_FULL_55_37]OGG65991.1 MAG: hypothetical protein A3D71_02110 [Candidatus Kaiserbacteria bacterium RIFCSPHIGHO2_02_FULL_55_20]
MPEGNTPSTSGSGNKMWYIIGGIVILALIGWFLMRGAGSLIGAASGVDVDRGANGATTYSNEEGSVTVGSGASMPSNWPSDAPANFAGANIVYSGTSNPQTGQTGSAVSYTVNASAASVADYYKQQLAAQGWTIQSTANMAGATVVAATKDTRTMGVYITDTADGNVSVVVGIEL